MDILQVIGIDHNVVHYDMLVLYDMMMIKDNHIDAAGGITPAILKAHEYKIQNNRTDLKVEVETRNLSEVKEVLPVT